MSARIKSEALADKAVRAPVRRWFMVPMRDSEIVEALHEPAPLPACGHPLPAVRGEGRERGANLVHGPNACEKRKRASHEPPLSRPAATLSPPCGERAGRGVPIWFMAPIRVQILEVPPLHEPPGFMAPARACKIV